MVQVSEREPDQDELREQRRRKLQRFQDRGTDLYPHTFHRSHTAAAALAAFDTLAEQPISVAGRIVAWRSMGKVLFGHIQDGTGRIQLYFRRDDLGTDTFDALRDFDLWDVIGVEGTLFKTRTGEITVHVRAVRLLAKCLELPPEKFHGLQDTEQRYRQRYLDLVANEESRDVFIKRSLIVRSMRRFLDTHDFLEVETPMLQPLYGGAAARPFQTYHNELERTLYLRISDELYLKRLIVGGLEKVYEISKDFRNEGVSFKHNPEFTMMELYWAYADYHDIMALTEQMICTIAQEVFGTRLVTFEGHQVDLTPPWRRLTLRDGLFETAGVDIDVQRDAETLYAQCAERGLTVQPGLTWSKLIDALHGQYLEPTLIQPTFLIDYPWELSPLAKHHRTYPNLVERFEPFVAGFEIGNAFTELNDPADQRARFLQQAKDAQAGDDEAHPLDEDYLTALSYGMPPTGGLGIGIDRLTMLLTNRQTIREVILFPALRNVR